MEKESVRLVDYYFPHPLNETKVKMVQFNKISTIPKLLTDLILVLMVIIRIMPISMLMQLICQIME